MTCLLHIVLLYLVVSVTLTTGQKQKARYHDYCIIGAGPAGLQMGYFLQKANRDYMIFERANMSGKLTGNAERERESQSN